MPESALSRTTDAIPCLVESVLKEHTARPPAVTLSWAQSKDGAIAGDGGARVTLSSQESMKLTHFLRSMHQAILVGIGTVLSDDPQLTVRLVEGPSPQPVVLDSALRFPVTARLFSRTDLAPWIFHAENASAGRVRELERRGARLFALPAAKDGLPLDEVLRVLGVLGIGSLMIEGGARVLRSFIVRRLAHQAVITVSPVTLQGLRIFERDTVEQGALRLAEMSQEKCGVDTVIWGRFVPDSPPPIG